MKQQILVGLFFLIFLGVLSHRVYSQQEPMFTQYNFNTQTINPAYAGTWEGLGFMVLGRHQWVGFEGNPRTYTFSMQSLLRNNKVGLGLNFLSDQVGLENRFSIFGDYTYGFKLSDKSTFRLGLKFGLTNYSNDLSRYDPGLEAYTDDVLNQDMRSRYMPNFGIGALWYSEQYFLGFSVPKIVQNGFDIDYGNKSRQSEFRHFFLSAGYVFGLSESVKFKPTFLGKLTKGAPFQLDLTGNFLLRDKFWLGASYRTGDSFGFIIQWIFDNKLRAGYAVDYFTTTAMRNHQYGSHEVMISYEFGSKRKWSTPRMF